MSRLEDGHFHLQQARAAEKNGNFLGARMEYMKCVESYKQAEATSELGKATEEYEDFVRRDPVFRKLLYVLNAGIKENPGILQSEITGKAEAMNWQQLYNYDRPIAKDDVYYTLYFADKFGYINRNKKGRSYELFSNGDIPMLEKPIATETRDTSSSTFTASPSQGSSGENYTNRRYQKVSNSRKQKETAWKVTYIIFLIFSVTLFLSGLLLKSTFMYILAACVGVFAVYKLIKTKS
ncbi:MAG: hypothetical protein LBQ14_07050 [Treponema sp.]|jgi:hypothetical protein|nr:hypothetical protein [Treponema sp.]